jgi:hypothetical protein
MASKIGKGLEQTLVEQELRADLPWAVEWIQMVWSMYLRYAVVGSCLVAAAILMVVSSNSDSGTDQCRNWYARSITSGSNLTLGVRV